MENITLKKMKSGAQQYTRGKTQGDRLQTLLEASRGAAENDRKLQKDITYEEEEDVLQKKRAKSKKAFGAYMKMNDAFTDEVDAGYVPSEELAKEKETSKSKANRDRQPYAKGGMVRGSGCASKGKGKGTMY